jgi:hypothetical protein
MKVLFRLILLGIAAGALVALLRTARGREWRGSVTDAARSALDMTGLRVTPTSDAETAAGDDLKTRIEGTRRRLEEQFAEDSTLESQAPEAL